MTAPTPETFWLCTILLATALMWIPYVLNRIFANGLLKAVGVSDDTELVHARWAERARWAHANAIENLAIFAPLVLLCLILNISTPTTTLAAEIYVTVRIAHYFIYMFGVPVLRTLTFAIGWGAQLTLLAAVLHWI